MYDKSKEGRGHVHRGADELREQGDPFNRMKRNEVTLQVSNASLVIAQSRLTNGDGVWPE